MGNDDGVPVTTPSVDVGALAGAIQLDASRRISEAVSLTVHGLEEEGTPLNERQVGELFRSVLRCFDGFETATIRELQRSLRGVDQWGLSNEHAFLERTNSDG